ncbi:hypothetical protein GWK36_13565 [Caldichromatium japonicum]|uniref:Uncharacterized protein n=1 Tax=Caldichromatium japonicum TaxID=2699430 RepID=A0A6G7VG30_9GAMM|nr:hypothetical protein [Caldichromatium japonicum]QIK38836.1 hypothetical protein GWK36_13565 [Caldichromatium japonicum]
MTAFQLASLILAGEFAVVSWLILFLFLRQQHQRQQDDHAHAGAVREHIEAHELNHREALTRLFETTYGLTGDELSAKVDEYLARERAFYNVMLNLYLNRDATRLKEIPAELAKVVKPWAEIAEMPQVGMVSASTVSSLENEKSQLINELEQTKETLEQLMQEYMAAFNKVQEEAPPPPPPPEPSDKAVDLDDIDVDLEPVTAPIQPAAPAPEPEPEPEPLPAAEAVAPVPAEERVDPEDIDAMLRALAEEIVGTKPPEPPPRQSEPEPSSVPPTTEEITLDPEETAEARAREELEGLADLFDTDSESK